jgi:hypothetical protein
MRTLRKFINNTHFSISNIANLYEKTAYKAYTKEVVGNIQQSQSVGNLMHKYITGEMYTTDSNLLPYIEVLNRPAIKALLDKIDSFEQELEFSHNGVNICGKYDAFDTKDKAIYDWKFTKKPKNVRYFTHYILQLAGYGLGLGVRDGYIVNIFPGGYKVWYIDTLPYQEVFKQIVDTLPLFYQLQESGDMSRFDLFDVSKIKIKIKLIDSERNE